MQGREAEGCNAVAESCLHYC